MEQTYWQRIRELAPMVLDRKHTCDDSCNHLADTVYITTLERGSTPSGHVIFADRESAAHGIVSGANRLSTEAEIKAYKEAEEKSRKEQLAQAEREYNMYVRRPMIVDTFIETATAPAPKKTK
jgi:hypothetical protein